MHEDLELRVSADTHAMEWTPSPGGEVSRKRMFHAGGAETGQVTCLVRYGANATFHEHGHPGGEEILILDGTFSDQTGDWGAGTLLLNPEGFFHAPHSDQGCLLLVRLRQYAGPGRSRVALNTASLEWQDSGIPGLQVKQLYEQDGFADSLRQERWVPGAKPGVRNYPLGVEIYVLSGSFSDEGGSFGSGCWLRLPVGSSHTPMSTEGCELYIKEAGLPALAAAGIAGGRDGAAGNGSE